MTTRLKLLLQKELRGMGKVFSFTFSRHTKSSFYKLFTVIVAAVCALLPVIIMTAVSFCSDNDEIYVSKAKTLLTVDEASGAATDFSILNMAGSRDYSNIEYIDYGADKAAAMEASKNKVDALVVILSDADSGENASELSGEAPRYSLAVLYNDAGALNEDDAEAIADFISGNIGLLASQKAGLDTAKLAEIAAVTCTVDMSDASVNDGQSSISESEKLAERIMPVIKYALQYINILVIYFLVLFYGQGVANSIIMEKTSKLLDTMLLSVKPFAMIFGKLLSIALAGIMQFIIWLASVACGSGVGLLVMKQFDREGYAEIMSALKFFADVRGVFSPAGIALAILIIAAGVLLYCSLAAVGGAVASTPEELASTNMIFSLTLVVSFFCCLSFDGFGAYETSSWINWFPFTAIMVAPGRLIVGDMPVWAGAVSFAAIFIFVVVIAFFAGRLYKMLALYKGNSVSLGKAFRMLMDKNK